MFGGIFVTNIFSFRATDPNVMMAEEDPVGPENDIAIIDAALKSELVVCGWGQHGIHRDRAAHVEKMLRERCVDLNSLGLTKFGMPRHPLYIPYSTTPKPWVVSRAI